ncbi:hypothetical protein M426DRAFT_8255 [Hypoxylon sp. CI-4A]|nr:hypothetical protein M426DRAFT_8255 [Hypoxylon sp. CI-4A]
MRFFLAFPLVLQPVLAALLPPRGAPNDWKLAQFDLHPFNLTDMNIDCTKDDENSPLFGCSIKFHWENPNADQSCTCKEDWQWDGETSTQGPLNNYSTNYLSCKNDGTETFQFKFTDMPDLSDFSLSLTHIYEDTKNFPAPTMTNMFAQPNITLQLLEISNTTRIYSTVLPIEANITGMTI